MADNIITELKNTLKSWSNTHAADNPKKFRISRQDEMRFLTLTADEIGDSLASKLMVEGARGAFSKLFGIPVEWNAKTTGIE
jgi:hypothetical protein